MHSWHRLLTAAIVVVAALILAKLVDRALSRREMAPEVEVRPLAAYEAMAGGGVL